MGRRHKELPPVEDMYAKIASILVPANILRDFDILLISRLLRGFLVFFPARFIGGIVII